MATKDLGRTPLEAGNTTEYHETRREVRRQSRHEAKAFCRNAARDPEFRDAMPAPVAPEHRRPGACWPSDMHADAIGPVKRWIHRQVSRPWDDVYSEIRNRFDVRTLAGRHIVEQHLLQYVDLDGSSLHQLRDLYVDGDGVLRERDTGYRRFRSERQTISDRKLARWLSGRKVGRRGDMFLWFVPTGACRIEQREVHRPRADHWGWENVQVSVPISTFRQGRPLSSKEVAFYERLTSSQRDKASEDLVIGRIPKVGTWSQWFAWLRLKREAKRASSATPLPADKTA